MTTPTMTATTGPTSDLFDNNTDNTAKGITQMIKKLSITAVIAGSVFGAALVGASAQAANGDSMSIAQHPPLCAQFDERLCNFNPGPGDPLEEQGHPQDPVGEPPASGGGSDVSAAPAAPALPDIQGGDDADKPVAKLDYSSFNIGPGDPDEESGRPVADSENSRVLNAPIASVLPDIQGGDDSDKPVVRPDYSGFNPGPGDPRDG